MKNITLKTISKISLVLLVISINQSCQNTLDETVIWAIPNEYINTPKGLDDATSAAYTSMRTWYGTERGHNFTNFGTDTYTNGADGSFKFMNTYTTQFDSQVRLLHAVQRHTSSGTHINYLLNYIRPLRREPFCVCAWTLIIIVDHPTPSKDGPQRYQRLFRRRSWTVVYR